MKSLQKISTSFKTLIAFIMLCFVQTIALAQDKKVDVNISTDKGGNWYAQPWVWIVGGAVLLLLIVALMRGGGSDRNGRTDKVTVTKSVKTDTDV